MMSKEGRETWLDWTGVRIRPLYFLTAQMGVRMAQERADEAKSLSCVSLRLLSHEEDPCKR